MPQGPKFVGSQEDLYKMQREARDKKAAPAPVFQSAPISDLVRASERARMLPARNVPAQGRLVVPPALLALLGLE